MEDIVKMMMEEEEHYETAYDNGVIRGKMEGKKEGKLEGRLEGKLEEKSRIAKNMLDSNMPIKLVSKYTGLTNSQVLALK